MTTMKQIFSGLLSKALLLITFVTGCTLVATPAEAQCSKMSGKTAIAWMALPAYNPMFLSGAPPRSNATTPQARGGQPSIVGLWQVNFSSGGQVVDQAYEVFHSDGTEMMVDTSAPASDNVCVGVWAQVNGLEYKLNHVSWTFDDQGNLNGTATIKLDVTLDANSNIFTGTFTVDVFDLYGSVVEHLAGTVAAKRVTVD
jgi:hypothetical protein